MSAIKALITRLSQGLRASVYNNADNKEVLASAGLIFVAKVLFAFIGFVVSIVITRYLTVAEAGYYFFMLGALAMLSTLSRVGLDNAIVRFTAVANDRGDYLQLKRILSLSISLALGGAAIISFVLWLAYLFEFPIFFTSLHRDSLLWMLCIIPVTSVTVVLVQSFQGLKRMGYYAGFNGLIRPLNLLALALILLFTGGLSIAQALWIYFAVALGVLVLAYVCWQRVLAGMSTLVTKRESVSAEPAAVAALPLSGFKGEFYSYSFSLWGIACLAIVMGQGAQVLLGFLSSVEQVAYFSVANRIALLVSFVLLAINGILSPKFAEISAQNDVLRLQQLYRASTRLMILLTSPFLLLIFIFSPEILLLFGSDYQQAATVLRILIAAQFVKVAVGSVGQLLIMANLQRSQRNNLIMSVVILISLSLYLMPMYGALGAAIACFVAITCNNVMGLFQVYKKLNIRVF